jgi:hypothetical protein
MLWIAKALWVYRTEVYIGIQLLNALRKSAKEAAQAYIRNRFKQQLMRSLGTMLFQLTLLGSLFLLTSQYPILINRLIASAVLWWLTAYNIAIVCFVTIPELRAVHRSLKSKRGYALKYFLKVSVVTELMQGSALWLTVFTVIGWSSRSFLGSQISYWQPWAELWFRVPR